VENLGISNPQILKFERRFIDSSSVKAVSAVLIVNFKKFPIEIQNK